MKETRSHLDCITGAGVSIRCAAVSWVFLLGALSPVAWAQDPAGNEFQVSTFTTGSQGNSAVASDENGNFVVAWQSNQDGSYTGIFGQRFSAVGVAQGSEFQINTYTTNAQSNPSIASDRNGNFVVVWQSLLQDGNGAGIFGQRFSAAGVAQGSEFQINSQTLLDQSYPSVASDPSGNFVVAWQSKNQDGNRTGIFGQRFDSAGVTQGTEFLINTYTKNKQTVPAVAADPTGNFVVVWQSRNQDGSRAGIFGQRFDSAGAAQGTEFQVNTYTTNQESVPAVATDATGNFVVAWQSNGQDGSGKGIFGQRYDSAGAAQGTEFQVNSYTTGSQIIPVVGSDEKGNFVVLWQGYGQDGSGAGIFGQRFTASGTPDGTEFQVTSYTTGAQTAPALARDPDGDFVVVWGSNGQDGDGDGVFAQRYGDRIFEDGFESGDLTRWSSSATDGGDLSVSGAAALASTPFGMQAVVNDTNPLFVQDDTPSGGSRYRVRFYFDPNGFDPGEGSGHFRNRIFLAFDGASQRTIALVLRRLSGAYSVRARVRLDDGTRANTDFLPITDEPHFFEFDWQRSSGANDGQFTLQIDDAVSTQLTGLVNDTTAVEFARLGALAVKVGATGTLFFDQFESRTQRLIGPE